MACEGYPTQQTAKTFALDAGTTNEVVTKQQDRTDPASDGETKKTFWGIENDWNEQSQDIKDRADQQSIDIDNAAEAQRQNIESTFTAQFAYKRVGNISLYVGDTLPEVDKLNSYQYPDDSGEWYGPVQDQAFPITIPSDPSSDAGWSLVNALTSDSLSLYTDIVYKASGGNSAVDNMTSDFAANPLGMAIGSILSTGGITWEYENSTGPITLDNFRALNAINVFDFGAATDGSDVSGSIQSAVDYISSKYSPSEQSAVPALLFPAGLYKLSSGISIPYSNFYATSDGIARLQFFDVSDNFSFFDIAGSGRTTIENLTFYMFGSDCTGISGKIWRQSTVENCQFVGGSKGISLITGADTWGTTIRKCRFQDCQNGADVIVNGQTFKFEDCLFFNTQVGGTDLTITGGSEVTLDGCVFESSSGVDRGTSITATDCMELTMIGVQTERLGVTSTDTGVISDYDIKLFNSNLVMISSRWWGGSFGSVSPGQSRNYGLYLDGNSTLKMNNSRIYSFRKVAVWSEHGATITTDLESQLDFRCLKGSPTFICSSDLGENQVVNGNYTHTNGAVGKIYPLGWRRLTSDGSQLQDFNTYEDSTYAAIDFLGSPSSYWTNPISATPGEWVTLRFIQKLDSNRTVRFDVRDDSDNSVIFSRSLYFFGGENNDALVVNSFQVPSGVFKINIYFLNGTYTEGVAVYRGVKANVTQAGSLYSDNDSNYGCLVDLAPCIPFKQNNSKCTSLTDSATWGGEFFNGDVVKYNYDVVSSASASEKIHYNGVWTER